MKYVLLCKKDIPDPEDVQKIEEESGVRILDHSITRAFLVEASEDAIARLRSSLNNWIVAEEVSYRHPVNGNPPPQE